MKKERIDHHITFLNLHQEASTTPKGLRIRIRISVPDYCGSALEASILKIQEETSRQARDLVLEHYRSLATKTNDQVENLKKEMSQKVEQLTELDNTDKTNFKALVRDIQDRIAERAAMTKSELEARRKKKLSQPPTITPRPRRRGRTTLGVQFRKTAPAPPRPKPKYGSRPLSRPPLTHMHPHPNLRTHPSAPWQPPPPVLARDIAVTIPPWMPQLPAPPPRPARNAPRWTSLQTSLTPRILPPLGSRLPLLPTPQPSPTRRPPLLPTPPIAILV